MKSLVIGNNVTFPGHEIKAGKLIKTEHVTRLCIDGTMGSGRSWIAFAMFANQYFSDEGPFEWYIIDPRNVHLGMTTTPRKNDGNRYQCFPDGKIIDQNDVIRLSTKVMDMTDDMLDAFVNSPCHVNIVNMTPDDFWNRIKGAEDWGWYLKENARSNGMERYERLLWKIARKKSIGLLIDGIDLLDSITTFVLKPLEHVARVIDENDGLFITTIRRMESTSKQLQSIIKDWDKLHMDGIPIVGCGKFFKSNKTENAVLMAAPPFKMDTHEPFNMTSG